MSVKSPSIPNTQAGPSQRPAVPQPSAEPTAAPDSNAVPFKVVAFAATVFPPPAISDAAEEEPVFDKSQAQRVVKNKRP